PTALNLLPVAGNPLPIGRNRPPNPAYPNEIGLVWVPRPISGDPLDVVAGRLLVRGHLFNWRGGLLGHNRSGRRSDVHGLSVGFVHRSPGQHIDPLWLDIIRSKGSSARKKPGN